MFWPGSATYNPTLPDPKEHVEGLKVNEAVPFRPIAYHVCFPDTYVFRMIRSALTLMFGGSRLRMRFHNGGYSIKYSYFCSMMEVSNGSCYVSNYVGLTQFTRTPLRACSDLSLNSINCC